MEPAKALERAREMMQNSDYAKYEWEDYEEADDFRREACQWYTLFRTLSNKPKD